MASTSIQKRSIERRAVDRQQTNFDAIVFLESERPLKCKIKNISSMGALLSFERPTNIPERFKLTIPEFWFEAECQIRQGSYEANSIGVVFTSNRREALARFSSPYCLP